MSLRGRLEGVTSHDTFRHEDRLDDLRGRLRDWRARAETAVAAADPEEPPAETAEADDPDPLYPPLRTTLVWVIEE
jgi:hypothetical protein